MVTADLWDRASRGVRALAVVASGVDATMREYVRSVPLPSMVRELRFRKP